METTIKLSNDLKNKIIDYLKANPVEIDYGHDTDMSREQIAKLFEKDGLWSFQDELYGFNIDYIADLEHHSLEYALQYFGREIGREIGEENIDYSYLASELKEDFWDYLSVDLNLKALIPSNIPVRVELYSNYDCINSHWFENQDGYAYQGTYIGDVVDRLNLNPAKCKNIWSGLGFNIVGRWPNKKNRDGKEFVDYKSFGEECLNSCCGANLLAILAIVDYDRIKQGFDKITIPKGNPVGFYSSMQGGGSIFECNLIRDMDIDLNKTYGSKYDHFGLHPDTNEYSIQNVFGSDSSMFGDNIA